MEIQKVKSLTTKTPYFLYVNFDSHRIGLRENKIGWEVGDMTVVNGKDEKVMVYALFSLTESARFVILRGLKSMYRNSEKVNFHEKLNEVVESIIEISSNESECRRTRENIMLQESQMELMRENSIMEMLWKFYKCFNI